MHTQTLLTTRQPLTMQLSCKGKVRSHSSPCTHHGSSSKDTLTMPCKQKIDKQNTFIPTYSTCKLMQRQTSQMQTQCTLTSSTCKTWNDETRSMQTLGQNITPYARTNRNHHANSLPMHTTRHSPCNSRLTFGQNKPTHSRLEHSPRHRGSCLSQGDKPRH